MCYHNLVQLVTTVPSQSQKKQLRESVEMIVNTWVTIIAQDCFSKKKYLSPAAHRRIVAAPVGCRRAAAGIFASSCWGNFNERLFGND